MGAILDAATLAPLTFAVRATIVLAVAIALTWAMRRGAAATRHALWTATYVALLSLPVAAALLPAWDLEVLPPAEADTASPELIEASSATSASDSEALATGVPGAGIPTLSSGAPHDPAHQPASRTAAGTSTRWFRSGRAGAAIWALGATAALVSLMVGTLRFFAMVRSARPVTRQDWLDQVESLRRRLGIDRRVRLLVSERVRTPMTGGWRRPVVLLPEDAATWSDERRHVVLAHELVHIRRGDVVRHVIGRVALALYWFHPLSWLAARLSEVTREQACDEEVLALGTRASDYASLLVDLAGGLAPTPALVSLPMIQRSHLERRVMAILDPRRPPRSGLTAGLALILVGGVGLTAAVARPTRPANPSGAASAAPLALSLSSPAASLSNSTPSLASPTALPIASAMAPQTGRTCDLDGLSGNFRGSMSTREDRGTTRTEHSGWYNDDRMIQRYVDGLRLCMRTHGEVVMNDDGTGVRAIGNDSWVVLEAEGDAIQRLEITEGSAGIEQTWTVAGSQRPFDADASAWRDGMFEVLGGFWEASRIRGQESSLRGRISSHRGHVSSLRGRISSARGHVSSLRGQASSYKGQVSSLRGQISSYRGHVSSLRGQISSYRGRVSSLRGGISSLQAKASSLSRAARATSDPDTRARLEQEMVQYDEKIREVERQIADYDVDAKTAVIEREIAEYDLEGKVAAVEARLAEYDVDGRVSEVDAEIAAYDLEGKVAAIEREIAEYDLDAKVREVEQQIIELDADRKAVAIERDLEPALRNLRELIGRL